MLETLQKSNFRVSDELHQPTAWRSSLLEIPGELSDPIQFRNIAQRSSFNTTAVLNGTLDTTDPSNATPSGSFRDDYLLTNLVAGQSVQLNLSSSVFDTYLQVVNAATGVVVAENDNFSGTNSQLDFTTQAGVDYIVRATSTALGATGAYSLSSNNGILTSATPISGSQSFSGSLVSSDPANSPLPGTYYDGYLLTNLTAGQVVQVNLNSTAFDSYLQIVNAATGAVVAENDNFSGTNSQASFTVQTGVDYIARATSLASAATGAYTLTTSSTYTVNGTLDSTDPGNPIRTGSFRDDYLLTNLVAGQSVYLSLNSSAFDTYLQVVDAATGAVVAENDNVSGTNSLLGFTTQAGVDYIVRATSTALGATGAYSLISNNGILTSATAISGSQTVSGTLVSSDPADPLNPGTYYDGYLLTNLTAGQVVEVNLNSTAFDTYLQVVNAATGGVVAENDNFSGTNSQASFTVQTGVDYIARATSLASAATGAYTLTTSSTYTVNGTLDSTDPGNPIRTGSFRDDYLLTNLVAGQSVYLSLNSSAFDTYLQVVDAATGAVVAENDNFSGTNSLLGFTTQAGVDY